MGGLPACGLLGETVMGLLQSFVPKTDVPSVAVFNTLNWSYSGIAKVYIDHQLLPRDKFLKLRMRRGAAFLPRLARAVRTGRIGIFMSGTCRLWASPGIA